VPNVNYFDALTSMAVQEWVERGRAEDQPEDGQAYGAEPVFGWWKVTEQMGEHYSTVGLDEKRAAVASVLRLLPGRESADRGADAERPANDTAAAKEAKAAN
jgi:hypothetical protein